MTIRIERVLTRIVNHKLKPDRVVISHAGKHDQSAFLQVTLIDADGQRGYAEAATTALWSGESAEVAQCVVEKLLAPKIIGATIHHPREAQAREFLYAQIESHFFAAGDAEQVDYTKKGEISW